MTIVGNASSAQNNVSPPPLNPATSGAVRVDFGSGRPTTYCNDCEGVPLEQAVRSGDTKLGYEIQARASGYDPRSIVSGSAEDKQVIADLGATLDRWMTPGAVRSAGIASNMNAFRAEAGTTVTLREQAATSTLNTATPDTSGPTYSATGAAQIPVEAGQCIMRDNPILEMQWRTTTSPVTGKSGFTQPLKGALDNAGIRSGFSVNREPVGGTSSNSPAARTQNGNAARDAIADRLRADPSITSVQTEVPRQTSLGGRNVDVVANQNGPRPEMNRVIEIESKLGRASASQETLTQVAKDAERLSDNATVRGLGVGLERVGRVARPIGVVIDAVQIGSAYRADGNQIGEKTQRAAGSLAGGAAGAWGGAQAGAAIGSLGGPIGTVVGGVIGGIAGGIVGSGVGEKAVDWVRSWF